LNLTTQNNTGTADTGYEEYGSPEGRMFTIRTITERPAATPILRVQVQIEGKTTTLDLDTGAAESVISLETYKRLGLPNNKIGPTTTILKSYSGDVIPVEGVAKVKVAFRDRSVIVPLFVVSRENTSLFGMSWLMAFGTEYVLSTVSKEVKIAHVAKQDIKSLLNTFDELFTKKHHTTP
jgi:hypothetical protein